MTLPPIPPDPTGGNPGDPLGPIPGAVPPPIPSVPPTAPPPPADTPQDDVAAPPPADTPPDAVEAQPEPAREPEPVSAPPQQPHVAVPQAKGKQPKKKRKPLSTLVWVVIVILFFSWTNGSLSDLFSDDEETDYEPPEPGTVTLRAGEYYSENFEMAVEVDGSNSVKRIDAWNHSDCAAAAAGKKTAINGGCDYGIEGLYQRADHDLKLYQHVLVYDDSTAAERAAEAVDEDKLPEQFSFSKPPSRDGSYGGLIEQVDEYLVVTMGVVDSGEADKQAEELFNAFHTENVSLLRFK